MQRSADMEKMVVWVMVLSGLIWIVLFIKFFNSQIGLFPDGASYFHWTKFYFDNVSRGVYPLWQPFQNWGYPVGFKLRFLGEFNPFLWIAFIPYKLGLPYDKSYFLYALTYFFSGIFAFYLISLHIYKDKLYAALAFILLLFSNVGIAIFFNFCEIVLLVPGLWFFYFWLKFLDRPHKKYCLGMVFSLMLILTSYIPFYFLTIFLTYLVFASLLYTRVLKNKFLQVLGFVKSNPIFTLICGTLIVVSAIPGYLTYVETSSSEFSYSHRQADSGQSAVTTGISMVNAGSVLGPVTFENIFSGLSFADNYLSYFFLGIIVYPIVLLGAGNPISRRLILYAGVSFIMLLITLTEATPILNLFYENVFYFKVMRNIFYLFYLVVPLIILFIVEQFQSYLNQKSDKSSNSILILLIVFGGFLLFLFMRGYIINTSYISIVLLGGLLLAQRTQLMDKGKKLFWVILFLIVILQPIEVFYHYTKNVGKDRAVNYVKHSQKPVFHFQRPKYNETVVFDKKEFTEGDGFVSKKFAGTRSAALLQKNMPPILLSEYTKDKFIIYDQIVNTDNPYHDWAKVAKTLSSSKNQAYVYSRGNNIEGFALKEKALIINKNSPEFTVSKFDMNYVALETDFKRRKYLVYNDSFHSGWSVKINGKSTAIYPSNIAFKGVWIDAGKNVVEFRFHSKWRELIYFSLIFIFLGTFMYLGRLYWQDRGNKIYA